MKNPLIAFQLIASLLSISCFCSEIGVPVLLWQQKTDSPLFDSKSTVSQIDGKTLAEDYLTNSQTIVAFVQKHLSLEQFTTEDEERLTSVKSIFRDQSIKPTLLIDVLNPTEALDVNDFEHQIWDKIHVKNGDKIWVDLPEDSLAENNQLLGELIGQIQKNVSKKALFLITGRKNQFQSIDLEPKSSDVHRRNVRAIEEEQAPSDNIIDDYLINVKDCLFLYSTSITLSNLTEFPTELTQFNMTKTVLDKSSSQCWVLPNKTSIEEHLNTSVPALLVFKMDDQNGTQITLKLMIENEGDKYFWSVVNSTATITSTKISELDKIDFDLVDNQISSEQWFGYSCSAATLSSKPTNDTKGELVRIGLTFSRFQLQPFANPHNRPGDKKPMIFTDTFDCEVWMTLPLWMGLLTLLLLFTILSVGVYFISIVNTPDRFENPKAKPLVITNTEE